MFYTYGYLFYVPITLILLLPLFINGVRHKRPLVYYAMVILWVIYLNKAIGIAFFPMSFLEIEDFSIYNNICLNVSLLSDRPIRIFFNILLTVPLGFGMQYILDTKNLSRVILTIILSASFELIQLVILVTLNPIDLFVDINDLIFNVCGGLIGLVIAYLINKLVSIFPRQSKQYDLFSYIHQVGINVINKDSSLNGIKKAEQVTIN